MKLLILALAIAVTSAFEYTTEWEMWKREHGKDYTYEDEEIKRHTIFESNKRYVDAHNENADRLGFTLALNKFADLESAEFAQIYNGYREDLKKPSNDTYKFKGTTCPDTVDWRTKGYVTPIKNQGQCGSCWSFSATGSLEGQTFKKTGKLVSLSEQQLVDCSGSYGNHGCEGGLMDNAFKYIEANGIESEEEYPYKAEDGKCHFDKSDVVATCTGYKDIPSKNCDDLQQAICEVGPISVAMDASHTSFQLYHSGIYDPWSLFGGCSSTRLDHGVLAIGYGSQGDKNYFLVKNSWGTGWGMKGYFMIANKNDKCGICTQASYPTV